MALELHIAPQRRTPLGLLVQEIGTAIFGWPFALVTAARARRRLRSYGPGMKFALRSSRGRHV